VNRQLLLVQYMEVASLVAVFAKHAYTKLQHRDYTYKTVQIVYAASNLHTQPILLFLILSHK
jgi:hypothetical protein